MAIERYLLVARLPHASPHRTLRDTERARLSAGLARAWTGELGLRRNRTIGRSEVRVASGPSDDGQRAVVEQ